MLILSRKLGEVIVIGADITVTLLSIDGSTRARIGVVAPKDVPVHREEVAERIKREQASRKR